MILKSQFLKSTRLNQINVNVERCLYPSKSFCYNEFIIFSHSIITAAHCLQNSGLVALTGAGSHSQESYEVPPSKQIKHPNYSSVYLTNDIAVLNVSKNISYNKSVFPAIIPIKTPENRAVSLDSW
jgi:hypothetical protein